MPGTSASDSTSSRYGISAASTAPPSGARKIAPMPAPMPQATAIRASRASRSSRRARNEPKPAPIWAVGPSRPPDPPDPIVIADATSLIKRDPRADAASAVVEGGDRGVGAVALGLRGEPEDDDPGDEAAEARRRAGSPTAVPRR